MPFCLIRTRGYISTMTELAPSVVTMCACVRVFVQVQVSSMGLQLNGQWATGSWPRFLLARPSFHLGYAMRPKRQVVVAVAAVATARPAKTTKVHRSKAFLRPGMLAIWIRVCARAYR